jgi:hypothetical protein
MVVRKPWKGTREEESRKSKQKESSLAVTKDECGWITKGNGVGCVVIPRLKAKAILVPSRMGMKLEGLPIAVSNRVSDVWCLV